MRIDKENIEAYILDYYEGSLNASEIEELFQFLSLNPEWKIVFDDFELITLDHDKTELDKSVKFGLKKEEINPGFINRSNVEEFIVKNLENDLSFEEFRELTLFISQNVFAQRLERLYKLTYLEPDKSVLYPYKSKLLSFTAIDGDINPLNVEEYIVRYIDNDLDLAEENKLTDYIAKHESIKSLLTAYKKTILEPDFSVVFPYRNKLKKPLKSSVIFTLFKYSSVAAVVLLSTVFYVADNYIAFSSHFNASPMSSLVPTEKESEDFNTPFINEVELQNRPFVASHVSYFHNENEASTEYIEINHNQSKNYLLNSSYIQTDNRPNVQHYYKSKSNKVVKDKSLEIFKDALIKQGQKPEDIDSKDIDNSVTEYQSDNKYTLSYILPTAEAKPVNIDISNLVIQRINTSAGTDIVENVDGQRKKINWRNVLYATAKIIKEKAKNSPLIKKKEQENSDMIAIRIGDMEIGRSFSK
ncbi:MAG: hypothetical protein HYZ42_04525 [Bacteroidetes bacterium]|nr:hypothetical protein [Bacteroidota bacterium]